MRVLEERKVERWSAQVRCVGSQTPRSPPGCGSLLEIVADDLKKAYVYSDSGDYKGHFAMFECPCCHSGTDIPEKVLPTWVFAALKAGKDRGTQRYSSGGWD